MNIRRYTQAQTYTHISIHVHAFPLHSIFNTEVDGFTTPLTDTNYLRSPRCLTCYRLQVPEFWQDIRRSHDRCHVLCCVYVVFFPFLNAFTHSPSSSFEFLLYLTSSFWFHNYPIHWTEWLSQGLTVHANPSLPRYFFFLNVSYWQLITSHTQYTSTINSKSSDPLLHKLNENVW